MSFIHKITALMLTAAATVGHGIGASPCRAENDTTPKTGSVVFIHPDGTSVSAWAALRLLDKGPDGHLNWDKMQEMGVYRGHLRNSLAASSHGGATTHAYGTKAAFDSYGSNPMLPVKALSGAEHSIMIEARNAGLSIGTINSGQIAEPGTGVFLASAYARAATDFITKQIVESGADIVMAGGEERLLPEGVIGRHGVKGIRKDGKNLIEKAQQLGYTVVYTRDQLKALPSDTEKVLGISPRGIRSTRPPKSI